MQMSSSDTSDLSDCNPLWRAYIPIAIRNRCYDSINTFNAAFSPETPLVVREVRPYRETGIIYSLMHSYGFIQCCERQARLFFHFSQFGGDINKLITGDPVEFDATFDRVNGRLIACQVFKIRPGDIRVTGTVASELPNELSNLPLCAEQTGRINYEARGECFFIPFSRHEVEAYSRLRIGDKVSFQIVESPNGNYNAINVRLKQFFQHNTYYGVVTFMKNSFGFIDCADFAKKIFFHYSEIVGNVEIYPGTWVHFNLEIRNGRESACNIIKI
ncbi:cold shock domain-containing protein E1-like [Teleopsis dalmanni]|uniref:cold shock domain-containing protein E1-like n=1 Tax=Teleopsis dalmanni TaxID=139649 RepID=UPI0018CDFEF3|nr:cold shock domain-containing protein E1-like [Teleopsis dalmanni]